MIDFIKLHKRIKDHKKLLDNPNLDWQTPTNLRTGEFPEFYFCDLKFLHNSELLRVNLAKNKHSKDWTLRVKNSLHKFYKGNNYSDFSFFEICHCIDELCRILDIPPNEFKVGSFEFGVNALLPFLSSKVYDNLFLYRRNPFSKIDYDGNQRKKLKGVKFSGDQFSVKCYDKGDQYELAKNLLRFEIKITKHDHLKKYGLRVKTLDCFQQKEIYDGLKKVLIDSYNNIKKRHNEIDLSKLDKNEKTKYLKLKELDWVLLNKENASKFTYRWKIFDALQKKAITNDYYKVFKCEVERKIDELISQESPLFKNREIFAEKPISQESQLDYNMILSIHSKGNIETFLTREVKRLVPF